MDQVNFVGIGLLIRSVLRFFPYKKNYKILLNTARVSRNLLDPNDLLVGPQKKALAERSIGHIYAIWERRPMRIENIDRERERECERYTNR